MVELGLIFRETRQCDGHTPSWMYLCCWLVHVSIIKRINFMYILPQKISTKGNTHLNGRHGVLNECLCHALSGDTRKSRLFACRVSGPWKHAVSLSLSGTRNGQPWPWGPSCASLWLIFSEVKLFSTCPMGLFSGKCHGRSCPRARPPSCLALRPAWHPWAVQLWPETSVSASRSWRTG